MKKFLIILVVVVLSLAITSVGGYMGYMSYQFYRIEDLLELTVDNNTTGTMSVTGEYSVVTYNIGFGAYNHDFSFFMDSGRMLDGTTVNGTMSKAYSRQVVLNNTNGAIDSVMDYNADFYFYQEVDTESTRSHKVNQYQMIQDAQADYSYTYGSNFHSSYLMYPFNDFHGSVNSGIATLSKHRTSEAIRYSFPIDESFPAKFFDLDRCFVINRIPLDTGKDLVMINLHMSAYDEGGLIRASQLELLNTILEAEYEQGNYVIAGGDFNHDIADSLELFETEQEVPEWVYVLDNDDLPTGFSFASSTNAPTCRSTDIAYTQGVNYVVVIDGFIVSDNVSVVEVENIDLDFQYSDHNPVMLRFELFQ